MKIVVLGPVYPYRGGIALFTTLLSQALAAHAQTRVISFKRQYPAWLYPGESDRDPSQQPLQLPAEYILDPLYPWTWLQAARAIAADKPDAVIIQWWTTFWAPAYAGLTALLRRRGIRVLYLIHNTLPHEPRLWDPVLTRLALGQGQGFLAMTDQQAGVLRRLLPAARIEVAAHPVYDVFAGERVSSEEARRRLNLPASRPIILFFGLVRQYKGLSCLLDALALLKDMPDQPYLVVAGEFWDTHEAYLSQIRQLDLEGHVRLDNRYIPNEEVAAYFSAANLFVAPYTAGTQSGALKMALGFCLPAVVSRTVAGDLHAYAGKGITVVEPGDALALAQGIRSALGSTESPTYQSGEQGWQGVIAGIEKLLG